jgi:pyridoxine 5-phosphate synthase
MPKLCVNIDHVATVRNARGGTEPDPLHGAMFCELGGAVGITFHLREDRRHINDEDAFALKRVVKGLLNMEMACTDEMVKVALKLFPEQVTLVPEKREELTTEGGLDVIGNRAALKKATTKLRRKGIAVSYFIDAEQDQIKASADCGATHVEFHTGKYANLFDRQRDQAMMALDDLYEGCLFADERGLIVNAGHGLNYRNVGPIVTLPFMNELNIGHAIIGRAMATGLEKATRDMISLIDCAQLSENNDEMTILPFHDFDNED